MRTHLIAALLLAALVSAGCAPVVGSGIEGTDTRAYIEGVTGVSVRDGIRVVIEVGTPAPLTITADDNYLFGEDHESVIATVLDGNTLDIFAREGIEPNLEPVVTIGVSSLEFVSATGETSEANVTGVSNTGRFGAAASTGGRVVVDGNCTDLVLVASEDGSLDADALEALDARLDAQGSSVIHARVTGQLEVRASGRSEIRVSGSPTVRDQILTGDSTLEILP